MYFGILSINFQILSRFFLIQLKIPFVNNWFNLIIPVYLSSPAALNNYRNYSQISLQKIWNVLFSKLEHELSEIRQLYIF